MAVTNGPNLKTVVNADIGDPYYPQLMRQWRGYDALVQCVVISRLVTTPPSSPAQGSTYIMPAGVTGLWTGQPVGVLATWTGSAWEFYTPENGWKCYVQSESARYRYKSGTWMKVVAAGARTVERGIMTDVLMTTSQAGQYTRINSAGDTLVTFTGVAPGCIFFFRQVGAGQIAFGTATYAKTRKQHSTACVIVTDTGIDVMGDLEVIP